MSHQTGITANNELLKFFGNCKSGNVRVFSVEIKDEQLCLGSYKTVKKAWDQEFDAMVLPFLCEKQPRYIMYRLDKKCNGSYEWLLICWSPDESPIREKMLYASTKASLKKEFGLSQIADEVFGTVQDDVNLRGYLRHKLAETSQPLTSKEEELKGLKQQDTGVDISVMSHQTLTGVSFPLTSSAVEALKHFSKGKLQYLQLKIDIDREEIHLSKKLSSLKVTELAECIPTDVARYHLFRYDHSYEGDYFYSVVFIYSMPGYSCPIKERMLYSSSRNPLIDYIENVVNLAVTKKLEVGEGSELTEEYLLDEIHPKQNLHRPKFSKPKGPLNRGLRRITKDPRS